MQLHNSVPLPYRAMDISRSWNFQIADTHQVIFMIAAGACYAACAYLWLRFFVSTRLIGVAWFFWVGRRNKLKLPLQGRFVLSDGVLVVAGFWGKSWQVAAYKKANNIVISNISSSLLCHWSKTLPCVKISHTRNVVMRCALAVRK